jgi:hypothetical protein
MEFSLQGLGIDSLSLREGRQRKWQREDRCCENES